MLTKNAIGNLIARYRAVVKKCCLINTFGSLAVAISMISGFIHDANATDSTNWSEVLTKNSATEFTHNADMRYSITSGDAEEYKFLEQLSLTDWGTSGGFSYDENSDIVITGVTSSTSILYLNNLNNNSSTYKIDGTSVNSLTFSGNSFSRNSPTAYGGVINCISSKIDVTGATFSNNSALSSGSAVCSGGVIYGSNSSKIYVTG